MFVTYLLSFWHLQITRGPEYARPRREQPPAAHPPVPPTRGVDPRPQGRGARLDPPGGQPGAGARGAGGRRRAAATSRSGARDPVAGPERPPAGDARAADLRAAGVQRGRRASPSWPGSRRAASGSRRSIVEEAALRDYPDGPAVAHAVGYVGEVSEAELARAEPKGDAPARGHRRAGREWRAATTTSCAAGAGGSLVTVNSIGRPFGEARPGKDPEDGNADPAHGRRPPPAQAGRGPRRRSRRGGLPRPAHRGGPGAGLDSGLRPERLRRPRGAGVWQDLIADPRRPLNDRAIASFYAPGSTFKILMSLAGLETGAITPSTIVHCSGSASIYGTRAAVLEEGRARRDQRAPGARPFVQRLLLPSRAAGRDRRDHTSTATMFHLGDLTGIDLPGEGRGILPSRRLEEAGSQRALVRRATRSRSRSARA